VEKPITQIDQVTTFLRSEILSGNLDAGTRLMEIPIAKQLGVSRTPVRISLEILERDGLVSTAGPKRGFVVSSFDIEEVFDSIAIRGALEGMAARLIAEQGLSKETQKILTDCFESGENLLKIGLIGRDLQLAWADYNAEFHSIIVRFCPNKKIHGMIQRLNRIPLVSPSVITLVDKNIKIDIQRLRLAQEDHAAIIDAIINREGSRADMLFKEHSKRNERNKREIFKEIKRTGITSGFPGINLVKN